MRTHHLRNTPHLFVAAFSSLTCPRTIIQDSEAMPLDAGEESLPEPHLERKGLGYMKATRSGIVQTSLLRDF